MMLEKAGARPRGNVRMLNDGFELIMKMKDGRRRTGSIHRAFAAAALFFVVFLSLTAISELSAAEKKSASRAAAFGPALNQADSRFLRGEAEKHLKKLEAASKAFQNLTQREDDFYSRIKFIGDPRTVEIDGRAAAYEMPLIAGDYSARFIYLAADGRLLYPPAAPSTAARYFLTDREWREVSADGYRLPSGDFTAAPPSFNAEYFPFSAAERHQNLSELRGVPAGAEALAGFKMLDYITQMPSKSIGKRKLTVLSRASQEIVEFTPLKSFSYAAAYCADWWHIAASSSKEIVFERYKDFITGSPAFGVDPRAVEMIYLRRAAGEAEFFGFSGYLKDPLFPGERQPSSLEGYASVLVLPEITRVEDASDSKRFYEIDPARKFYMGQEYIELFRGGASSAETLVTALETHGIVMAGISFYMKGAALSHPAKAVAVVGYKKAGGSTLFAYKDFEDPAKIFRIAPAGLFCEAYCFAREFKARARYIVKKRRLVIETFDGEGNRVDVDSISASFPYEGRRVKFLREDNGIYFHQVRKEDFAGVERAKLIAEIRKKYFVCGDKDAFTVKYAIY